VRLASQLTGWEIDILTEDEESQRRQDEFRQRSELFTAALDVEETIAQLLVAEGFTSLEEVAYVELDELSSIEGFDDEIAEELQARAVAALEAADAAKVEQAKELGVEDDVTALEGLTPAMLVTLGEAGIKTLDDLGDLASDELIDRKDGILKAYDLSEDEANAIIMAARAHWFEDEDVPAPAAEAPAETEEEAPAGDQA
jgi:N utilization substance protein A